MIGSTWSRPVVWHRQEIQKQEFLERLLYSLCTPIVRLGRVSKFSLKDLERILRIAYFRALKDEGMSNKEVAEAMGVSESFWKTPYSLILRPARLARVRSLMARTGKTVSELVAEIDALAAGGAGYAIVKRKVEIASKADAEPAVQAVARAYASERVDRQDGVRVDFEGGEKAGKWAGSWVHVRASNTEPIMRGIVVAPTAEAAGALADEVGRVIAAG